jgi:hypothetical protein
MSGWGQVGSDVVVNFANRSGSIDWGASNVQLTRGDVLVYILADGSVDHSQMILNGTTTYAANNLWTYGGASPPWDWSESTAGARFANFPADEEEAPREGVFPFKIKVFRAPQ